MGVSLKQILSSENLEFIMEAHNGISAKIVEKAGFKAIWASGLAISASHGVRDASELSSTQVLNAINFMSDAVDIPILLDADTGFGDFNNFRRLINELEKIKIAGVCIEDKLYPKKNSFTECEQHLDTISNFVGKIKAGKDSQKNDSFVIVARTESFIAGKSLEEAIERASLYAEAGADAILVHSKLKDFSQISQFMKKWNYAKPIIIVPTTYSDIPIEVFKKSSISAVIWANHNLRACIKAMEMVSQKIFIESSISGLSSQISSINRVFELTNMAELMDAERKYTQ